MNLSTKNPTVKNNNYVVNQSKNPSFNAKLSLSRQASKLLAEKCQKAALEANNGVHDAATYMVGHDMASYIDNNINYLAEMVKPLKPVDFPVVIDVSQQYKNFLKHRRQGETFDNYHYGEFEICPNGTPMNGLDFDAVFNFNFSMRPMQMERLYYVIKERMDILFNKM